MPNVPNVQYTKKHLLLVLVLSLLEVMFMSTSLFLMVTEGADTRAAHFLIVHGNSLGANIPELMLGFYGNTGLCW